VFGKQLPDLLGTGFSLCRPEPDVREPNYSMLINDDARRHTRDFELFGPVALRVETNLEIGMENLQESIRSAGS
jgi:hypothetical protein